MPVVSTKDTTLPIKIYGKATEYEKGLRPQKIYIL